ncbi:hypothetical protein ACHAQH_004066 [Verticillium albo-atrum]
MSRTTVPCAHLADDHLNSKRLVVCCDGTWNNANDGDSPATNVSRLAGAVAHKCCTGMPQIVYYHPGAGTESSWVAKKLGGLLGLGVVQDIAETYRFICDNYNPGDEIILIGFSRGAFTARSVADMICNLGFLNRAGLDHLGDIFHDYATWEEWAGEKETLDPAKHLVGFCIENYDQMRRKEIAWREQEAANLATGAAAIQNGAPGSEKRKPRPAQTFKQSMESAGAKSAEQHAEAMENKAYKELMERKQALWAKIRAAKSRSEISELYRQELVDQRLALMQKSKDETGHSFVYVACPAEVKAVGVWDTVGSLGVPKGPLRAVTGGRSDDEIRFASLEMHRNVQHAFHALALDEYRTAFSPTLWERGPGNSNTVLRQVWFAGNHGDVGGGWEDEQSANVALAWMADQLASVGVEFSRPEMQRVFYDVHATAVPERWGMADIHKPPFKTAAADVLYSGATFSEPAPRKPGLYCRDVVKDGNVFSKVGRTVSGWFGGGPKPVKLSRAEEMVHPSVRIRYQCGGKGPNGETTYRCRALLDNGYQLEETTKSEPRPAPTVESLKSLYGVVGGVVAAFRNDSDLSVAPLASLPQNASLVRVQQLHEEFDVVTLPPAQRGWIWRRPAQGKEEAVELPEEQIGMWERLYMKVQEELVDWQPLYVARQAKLAAVEAEKKWAVTRVAGAAASGTGNLVSTGFGAVKGWLTKNAAVQTFLPWGYHDMVVWLRGDVRKLLQ